MDFFEQIERQQRDAQNRMFQSMENEKQIKAMDSLSKKIDKQNLTQTEMSKAVLELVKSQNESNKIMQDQCEELKIQNELLQQQNESQAKELKKQKIWNWITYGITTLIAIASVVGTFISIFK